MARPKILIETVILRLPDGKVAEIDRALAENETRQDIIRAGLDSELKARQVCDAAQP